MKNNTITEVLAPVGNKEMLIAAVKAGADAVYLGAKDFNARRNADNFDIDSLKEAVEYCHIRGVKVYLTLNILISDNEIEKAVKLATYAYNIGVDGIIIADLGLASILNKEIPKLPLHASTQMTVCSFEALYPLKEMGFTRVVAAREMNKEQLALLCSHAKKLNMEVEVFVHGALCMCLSGQCLMSALLGGRSGNRGLCAGPCRLPFKDDFGNDYVLSLKDLSLLEHVGALKEMGVASLKIEGRMKRSEYVAAATLAFRSMVDTGTVQTEVLECLQNVFSRSGFTDGYFKGTLGKDMFGIRTKEDVIGSTNTYPFLHNMIRHERQSVKISVKIVLKKSAPATLTLTDGSNSVTVWADIVETAVNKPITKEKVTEQLLKLGSTPYFADNTEVLIDPDITVRLSALNELRRQACNLLSKKRAECLREAVTPNLLPLKEKEKSAASFWVRVNSLDLLPNNLEGVSAVVLPIENDHNLLSIKKNVAFIAELPRAGLFGKKLEERLKKAKELGFSYAIVQNLGQLNSVKKYELIPIAGTGLNIFSSYSVKKAEELGFNAAFLSPELNCAQISKIKANINTVTFAYGKLPLMITKNCPVSFNGCVGCNKNRFITDRKGVSFAVQCRSSYSEIFADRPIWLAERLKEFKTDIFYLYFTSETQNETEAVLTAYKNAGSPKGAFNRGLYYRGVE